MAKLETSTKRVQIDKANLSMVIITSVAVFVTVFSLIASYSLLGQRSYQAKVISEKKKAKTQLDTNVRAVDNLVNSYKQFVADPENIIGGLSSGEGDRDGDNAQIILNALPSQYDFPAVTASLEKLVTSSGNTIENIAGVDNEVTAATMVSPTPIEIPFELGVKGNYSSLQSFVSILERSTRPISATKIQIEAEGDSLVLRLYGKTYYQSPKTLNIESKVVK